MKKVIRYQAYDDALFNDEKACLRYEKTLSDLDRNCENLYACLEILDAYLKENKCSIGSYKTLLTTVRWCKQLVERGKDLDIHVQSELSIVIGLLNKNNVSKTICSFFQEIYNIKFDK